MRPARPRRLRAAIQLARTSGSARRRSSSVSVTSDHIQSRACSPGAGASAPAAARAGHVLLDASHTSAMPAPRSAEHVRTRDRPAVGARPHEVQRVRVVGRGVAGAVGEVAVGLVDDDEVGELDDAALHALQLVARARARAAARTGRPCPRPRPPTGRRRRSRRARRRSPRPRTRSSASRVRRATPPSVPPDGDGRMNASGRARQLLHARLVAEDRAAAARARRVDREHRDAGGRRRRDAGRAPR